MSKVELTTHQREVTLGSGRKVVLGPLKWDAFEPLMAEVFKVYVDRLKDLGNVHQGPNFMVTAVYAMLGEPQRWMHVAATTVASWIAWGSVYDPVLPLNAKGGPDLSAWSADEVSEVMSHTVKLTDFKAIAARLKNLLGPIADDIAGLSMMGRKDSDEPETSAAAVEQKDSVGPS